MITLTSKFQNQGIRSLTIDSKGNMWAGTLNGMYRVHLPSGETDLLSGQTPSPTTRAKVLFFTLYVNCRMEKFGWGQEGRASNIYDPKHGQSEQLYGRRRTPKRQRCLWNY
jgi:hypothetical protein